MTTNLIWLVRSEYEVYFSFDWIQNIFSSSEIRNYYDINNKFDLFLDNSVLIVSVTKDPNNRLMEYIDKYNSIGMNYTILHLSDEAFEQNVDFYNISNKIIRNYYNKEYVNRYKNIMTIPLGYQTNIRKISSVKEISVNFIGQLKSDRYEMMRSFSSEENKFIHLTKMWGDPNGLNTSQFSSILSKSWFTLCPRGWISLDSFRINEALECGSTPISILDTDGTDYFEKVYGDHPFIIGKDWIDAFDKYKSINKEEINKKCENWWGSFKESLKFKIKDFTKNK